jgi:hypothetical protein
MSEEPENLPSVRDWLQQWLGFQLPSIPLPQTLKNLDKAIATVVLATANNAKVRIDGSTNKVKAANKLVIEDMFQTASEKRKFENRAGTTRAAIDDLKHQPPEEDATGEVEEDWLNTFGRLAEEKSSEELQALFGRILAGEIRKPGSFSLRTLQFIANLSKADAEAITRLFPYVLGKTILPFMGDEFVDLSIPARIGLEELGIISGSRRVK